MRKALLAMAFLSAIALAPGMSHATPIIRVGQTATVNVGDVFTVPVLVSEATDLMAFQFELSFDSTVLTALSFTDVGTDFEAAAIAGGGALTGITGFLFPGLLSGIADSMSGAISGLTGGGVLVNVEFMALANGVSPLNLSNVFLDFSPVGVDSIVNGSVVVPEPATVLLLVMGLAVLCWRRIRHDVAPD